MYKQQTSPFSVSIAGGVLRNESIHIEWNGVDHYSAHVSPNKLTKIDPAIFSMLKNVAPCSMVNPKRYRRLQQLHLHVLDLANARSEYAALSATLRKPAS